MFDVAIIESGSGGDLVIQGNDLALIYGIENQPYLASFGGNIEADTNPNIVPEQALDYWGNALLMANNPTIQFNSKLERVLRITPLTSAGRTKIINALTQDLQYLTTLLGNNIDISVSIISDNWLQISLSITLPKGVRLIIINYKKQEGDGDFSILDFSDSDFF